MKNELSAPQVVRNKHIKWAEVYDVKVGGRTAHQLMAVSGGYQEASISRSSHMMLGPVCSDLQSAAASARTRRADFILKHVEFA